MTLGRSYPVENPALDLGYPLGSEWTFGGVGSFIASRASLERDSSILWGNGFQPSHRSHVFDVYVDHVCFAVGSFHFCHCAAPILDLVIFVAEVFVKHRNLHLCAESVFGVGCDCYSLCRKRSRGGLVARVVSYSCLLGVGGRGGASDDSTGLWRASPENQGKDAGPDYQGNGPKENDTEVPGEGFMRTGGFFFDH